MSSQELTVISIPKREVVQQSIIGESIHRPQNCFIDATRACIPNFFLETPLAVVSNSGVDFYAKTAIKLNFFAIYEELRADFRTKRHGGVRNVSTDLLFLPC